MLEGTGVSVLRALWSSAWGKAPPKAARRRFLQLGIAWKWQADALGGFRPELARRLSALEEGRGRGAHRAASAANAARPGPGTRLIREWKGTRHEVHVVERGYLWRGATYGSLSAVATAITGTSRNGPKFFGLRDNQAGT
ncbi:MAG: DUF2924 domain-containing protein [Pseudomonadota bacterium]